MSEGAPQIQPVTALEAKGPDMGAMAKPSLHAAVDNLGAQDPGHKDHQGALSRILGKLNPSRRQEPLNAAAVSGTQENRDFTAGLNRMAGYEPPHNTANNDIPDSHTARNVALGLGGTAAAVATLGLGTPRVGAAEMNQAQAPDSGHTLTVDIQTNKLSSPASTVVNVDSAGNVSVGTTAAESANTNVFDSSHPNVGTLDSNPNPPIAKSADASGSGTSTTAAPEVANPAEALTAKDIVDNANSSPWQIVDAHGHVTAGGTTLRVGEKFVRIDTLSQAMVKKLDAYMKGHGVDAATAMKQLGHFDQVLYGSAHPGGHPGDSRDGSGGVFDSTDMSKVQELVASGAKLSYDQATHTLTSEISLESFTQAQLENILGRQLTPDELEAGYAKLRCQADGVYDESGAPLPTKILGTTGVSLTEKGIRVNSQAIECQAPIKPELKLPPPADTPPTTVKGPDVGIGIGTPETVFAPPGEETPGLPNTGFPVEAVAAAGATLMALGEGLRRVSHKLAKGEKLTDDDLLQIPEDLSAEDMGKVIRGVVLPLQLQMASSIQGIESVLKEIVHSGRITTVSETKQISVPGLQEDAGVDAVARANDTLPSWLRKFEDSNNENPALNTPTQNLTKAA